MKNNFLLSILIINYNSSDFVLNGLYCLDKLTKNKFKVIILDNGSEKNDFENLKKKIIKHKNIELTKTTQKHQGSLAHGEALNEIVKNIDTPYFVIIDADAAFLIKNWDEILMQKMRGRFKVVGTQRPKPKQQTFPSIYASIFETKTFKKLNIDFRPNKNNNLLDTGYEIEDKYPKNGYLGILLKMKNTRTYKKGPFKKILCAEYYLEGYNDIIATHFGRGSTKGAAKYQKKMIYKIPFLGHLLLNNKGEQEKKYWLKICRNIVQTQL